MKTAAALLVILVTIIWLLFMVTARPAHAESCSLRVATCEYTASDTLAAIEEASSEIGVSAAYLTRVVACESGFDPYAVGRQGELGAVQLHPRGLLPVFRSWGYTDPFSPYQSVRFMAQRFAMGGARAWTCS